MSMFEGFLNSHGQKFQIERDGNIVHTLEGLENYNSNTNEKLIQFVPGSDVKIGDWVINDQGERFYIIDTRTNRFRKEIISLDCSYLTQAQYSQKQSPSSVTFTIGSASNSIRNARHCHAELFFLYRQYACSYCIRRRTRR